jgi:hypothetical protein
MPVQALAVVEAMKVIAVAAETRRKAREVWFSRFIGGSVGGQSRPTVSPPPSRSCFRSGETD